MASATTELQATLRRLVLERIYYFATKPIGPQVLHIQESGPRITALQSTADRLVVQLMAYVYAERVQLEEVEVIVEQPADWWQHLRAQVRRWALDHSPRWCPRALRWWLQQLPVRHVDVITTVRFDHYVKYPEFMTPADIEDRRHLGKPVPEVRIGGSWQTYRRVLGWWKEGRDI